VIGDFLYRLTSRDQQVQQVEAVSESVQFSVAAVSLNARWQVPNDRVLLLKGLAISAQPGGAQTVSSHQANIFTPQLTLSFQLDKVAGLAVAFLDRNKEYDDLVVPSGWIINSIIGFSAGAVANASQHYLAGVLIPRGNVAEGQLLRLL